MLNDILHKSVSISLANGAMINGFVVEIDDDFLKLVEFDNSKVIARKGDISYVKVHEGGGIAQNVHRADNVPVQEDDENNYVMPHQFAQQQQQYQPRQQEAFYVIRGKAQPQREQYSMNNPNFGATTGPKLERQT